MITLLVISAIATACTLWPALIRGEAALWSRAQHWGKTDLSARITHLLYDFSNADRLKQVARATLRSARLLEQPFDRALNEPPAEPLVVLRPEAPQNAPERRLLPPDGP